MWNLSETWLHTTDCGSDGMLFFFSFFLSSFAAFSLGLFSFLSASLFLLSILDLFLVIIKTYVQYKCCSSCDRDTGNTYITYTVHYIYIYTIVLWVQKRKKKAMFMYLLLDTGVVCMTLIVPAIQTIVSIPLVKVSTYWATHTLHW